MRNGPTQRTVEGARSRKAEQANEGVGPTSTGDVVDEMELEKSTCDLASSVSAHGEDFSPRLHYRGPRGQTSKVFRLFHPAFCTSIDSVRPASPFPLPIFVDDDDDDDDAAAAAPRSRAPLPSCLYAIFESRCWPGGPISAEVLRSRALRLRSRRPSWKAFRDRFTVRRDASPSC